TFVSEDKLSAISMIQHKYGINDVKRHSLLNWLDDVIKDLNDRSGGRIVTKYTGQVALWNDMQEESKKTIKSHLFVIPLILLIFGYTIGSWRLTLIPIVAMLICVSLAFMMMLPFTDIFTVSTMTPTIMTSISLAMCIDYNLFMLIRFREEVGDEREVLKMSEVFNALHKTVNWSGHVVLVSGFILALSLMGYIFCSIEFLKSYGLGAAIAVGCAIAINLTLTPALLLLAPRFFTQFGFNCRLTTIIDDLDEPQGMYKHFAQRGGEVLNKQKKKMNKQIYTYIYNIYVYICLFTFVYALLCMHFYVCTFGQWKMEMETKTTEYKASSKDTSALISKVDDEHIGIRDNDDPFHPFEITAADEANYFKSVGSCAARGRRCFHDIEISYAQTLDMPRDSTHWKTFHRVSEHFSSGLIGPMYILIRAPSGVNVFNYSYINDTALFFQDVLSQLNDTVGQVDHVRGVSVVGGQYLGGKNHNVTQSTYQSSYAKSKLYHALVDSYVGQHNAESYFVMLTHNDPNGMDCKRIVNHIRDVINPTCKRQLKPLGYQCYYYSNSAKTVDAIDDLYRTFPWILFITMIFIFLIAGLIWRNMFLPLRLFLTIAMPMFMIYGLTVLVFQHGWLSWLHSKSVDDTHGIAWIIPLMTITLLFGLALDYDIFLWSRIDEYMKHGIPLRPAIVRGVFKTGSIITAAGLIMACAFSGLLLSTVPALNQAGFILVASVLVDTFIIRTSLVPSILSISLNVTWHPKWQQRIYHLLGWSVPHTDTDTDTQETARLLHSE
ncbi:MmpL efflux pump, partial [Reticulomyxa filosa]